MEYSRKVISYNNFMDEHIKEFTTDDLMKISQIRSDVNKHNIDEKNDQVYEIYQDRINSNDKCRCIIL